MPVKPQVFQSNAGNVDTSKQQGWCFPCPNRSASVCFPSSVGCGPAGRECAGVIQHLQELGQDRGDADWLL